MQLSKHKLNSSCGHMLLDFKEPRWAIYPKATTTGGSLELRPTTEPLGGIGSIITDDVGQPESSVILMFSDVAKIDVLTKALTELKIDMEDQAEINAAELLLAEAKMKKAAHGIVRAVTVK